MLRRSQPNPMSPPGRPKGSYRSAKHEGPLMSPPSDDNDATRIRPATKHDSFALPIGTRLGEFELTHHIGEGGFGIVYLAYDHTLDRSVALKEYMPSSLATRVGDKQINVRSERYRETFEAGMKSFINEAKLLARFDHPSLVK